MILDWTTPAGGHPLQSNCFSFPDHPFRRYARDQGKEDLLGGQVLEPAVARDVLHPIPGLIPGQSLVRTKPVREVEVNTRHRS